MGMCGRSALGGAQNQGRPAGATSGAGGDGRLDLLARRLGAAAAGPPLPAGASPWWQCGESGSEPAGGAASPPRERPRRGAGPHGLPRSGVRAALLPTRESSLAPGRSLNSAGFLFPQNQKRHPLNRSVLGGPGSVLPPKHLGPAAAVLLPGSQSFPHAFKPQR